MNDVANKTAWRICLKSIQPRDGVYIPNGRNIQ